MNRLGMPTYLTNSLASLYDNQMAVIDTPVGRSDALSIGRGVRQGCPLSPTLFNLYSEMIMREALDGWNHGVRINGEYLSDLRYADDVVLMATNEDQLQDLVNRVGETSARFGLKLNEKKTEIMVFARTPTPVSIKYQDQPLKQVNEFTYLGALFNSDCSLIGEVKRRIVLAKKAAGKLNDIWQGRDISLTIKKRLMEMLVWSIVSYASETWTYNKNVLKRISSFETWCYRRILMISWKDRITNEQVYNRTNSQPKLCNQLLMRRANFFGHLVRKEGLSYKLMVGRVLGFQIRGRPRTSWINDMSQHLSVPVKSMFRSARNREEWRKMVARIGNPV